MGVSIKTLSRIQKLNEHDFLPIGSSIVELGSQNLSCKGRDKDIREFIRHFTSINPSLKNESQYQDSEISSLANSGLMGKLMNACGFKYCALDIFDAEDTILFDLNLHEVPKNLYQQFDLVTNFGTTEHVINQLLAMKTIHDLAKPGGIIYHDLPMSGYHYHGYFSYTPLFFFQLAAANDYKVIMQSYSKSTYPTDTPYFMVDNGYSDKKYHNCGIEFIFQKTSSEPFRMPLEVSTSLGLNESLWGDNNPYANTVEQTNDEPSTLEIPYHSAELGLSQIAAKGTTFPPLLELVNSWEIQRELIKRYKMKLLNLFRSR